MRNTLLISIGFFVLFAGFASAQQYLLVIFEETGRGHLALFALMLLYGAFALSGLGAAKLISFLGGLKRSLIIGTFTYILFVASVALGNTSFILVCAVLMGVGATLVWVPSGQMIVESSSTHTRGRNLSFQTVGLYVGTSLGVWVGGFLYETASIYTMYLVLASLMLFSIPLFLLTKPVQEVVVLRPFRPQFFFDHRMLLLLPILAGAYFLQGQTFTAMNLIIVGVIGASALPLVIGIVRLSNMAGSLSSGALSDRINKGVVLAGVITVALIGTCIFTFAANLTVLIVGSLLLGFSMASFYPVCLSWLKEKMAEDEYLDALGVFHVYTNIGTLLAITTNLWLPAATSFMPAVIALLIGFPCIIAFHRLQDR